MRAELRAGAAAVAPMLVGVVPFGLVAGASPAENDLGWSSAIGFSTIVFAGASQLAAIDVLGDGGSALVAALAAWTINLRMLLYSASLAPHLAATSVRRRLEVAYLLTDQAYAVSLLRWEADPDEAMDSKLRFYFGAGLTLWLSWQLSTIAGVLVGPVLPDDVPLEFAVPLVFLVLLLPTLTSRPALAAAIAGGLGAVVAAEAGAGSSSIMVGALTGIVVGAAIDRQPPDEEPAPGLDTGATDDDDDEVDEVDE